MARKIIGPRKRRTRSHAIADQSINHVERFIIDEGHTAQRVNMDYGYDLLLFTYDEEGYAESDVLVIQLKATESLQAAGADYLFDLDIRDYNLWMLDKMPVITPARKMLTEQGRSPTRKRGNGDYRRNPRLRVGLTQVRNFFAGVIS